MIYGSKSMAKVVTKLAVKHGLDLSKGGAIRLDNPGYERLCIEVIGPHQVSVAHYYEQNGDLVADPDIAFFTGYEAILGWVPMYMQDFVGFREAAELREGDIGRYWPAAMKDITSFVNQWARNIGGQRWLDRAVKHQDNGDDSTTE